MEKKLLTSNIPHGENKSNLFKKQIPTGAFSISNLQLTKNYMPTFSNSSIIVPRN